MVGLALMVLLRHCAKDYGNCASYLIQRFSSLLGIAWLRYCYCDLHPFVINENPASVGNWERSISHIRQRES